MLDVNVYWCSTYVFARLLGIDYVLSTSNTRAFFITSIPKMYHHVLYFLSRHFDALYTPSRQKMTPK